MVKVRVDQNSNEYKKSKNGKPVHIVFLYHILPTQIDKHGIHTTERKLHVPHVISPSVMCEVKKVELMF